MGVTSFHRSEDTLLWPTHVFCFAVQMFAVISCHDLKINCFYLKTWIYINFTVQKLAEASDDGAAMGLHSMRHYDMGCALLLL